MKRTKEKQNQENWMKMNKQMESIKEIKVLSLLSIFLFCRQCVHHSLQVSRTFERPHVCVWTSMSVKTQFLKDHLYNIKYKNVANKASNLLQVSPALTDDGSAQITALTNMVTADILVGSVPVSCEIYCPRAWCLNIRHLSLETNYK